MLNQGNAKSIRFVIARSEATWVRSRRRLCRLTDAAYPLRVQSVRRDAGHFSETSKTHSAVIARLARAICTSRCGTLSVIRNRQFSTGNAISGKRKVYQVCHCEERSDVGAQPSAALPPYGCGLPLAGAICPSRYGTLLRNAMQMPYQKGTDSRGNYVSGE